MNRQGKQFPCIQCPQCKKVSYNTNDIKYKFCGYCHEWHEFMATEDKGASTIGIIFDEERLIDAALLVTPILKEKGEKWEGVYFEVSDGIE